MIPSNPMAAGAASTLMMRSMIEEAEERRIAEEEARRKTSGKDDILAAKAERSKSHAALNDKINAHFFGALKSEETPMAQLMARFLDALGLQRDADEGDTDFAVRVKDAMTLVDYIGKKEAALPPMDQKISLKRFLVSVDELKAALDPSKKDEPRSAMTDMMVRYVGRLAIEPQADRESDALYSARIGQALAAVRKPLAESIAKLEIKSGLRDIGVTADQMVAAIANPSGDIAKMIADKLDTKAREAGVQSKDMTKVIQRLEEVADPKSLEELKLERTDRSDPTRVEDAETKKEREEQIVALEAADKLEDVEKARETIAEVNAALGRQPDAPDAGTGTTGTAPTGDVAGDLLAALAAGAEVAQAEAEIEEATAVRAQTAVEAAETAVDETAGKTEEAVQAEAEADQIVIIARAGPGDPGTVDAQDEAAGILPVAVDENGVYALLKRKAQEAENRAAA